MRKGTVKQFDPNSAYGFIEDDLTHSSYFVFYKSIKTNKSNMRFVHKMYAKALP